MHHDIQLFAEYAVTPFVGVWIETRCRLRPCRLAVSHPSWVCGLKQNNKIQKQWRRKVTPFVGVWIETTIFIFIVSDSEVTPFVGVWIETVPVLYLPLMRLSHPSWVCGLKHYPAAEDHHDHQSHPSWVCGLKQERYATMDGSELSHPSWVCGLKL